MKVLQLHIYPQVERQSLREEAGRELNTTTWGLPDKKVHNYWNLCIKVKDKNIYVSVEIKGETESLMKPEKKEVRK